MKYLISSLSVFAALTIIQSGAALHGCGGGGSSSSDVRSRSDERKQRELERELQALEKQIVDTRSSPDMYYPRGKSSNRVANDCPQAKPLGWESQWLETCREMKSEITKIRQDDFWYRTTTYPHFEERNSEDIHVRDGLKKVFHKTGDVYHLRRIHTGTQVVVFDGTSASDDTKHLIFKYLMNCKEIQRNARCDKVWKDSELEDREIPGLCLFQYDEDPLLTEYVVTKILSSGGGDHHLVVGPEVVTLSPSVPLPGTGPYEKINFKVLEDRESSVMCQGNPKVFVRLLVEEKVGPTLSRCMFTSRVQRPTGENLVRFATGAFIRLTQLLKEIHSIGYIHADIHSGNVAFKDQNSGCDFEHPENLIFIDFGNAEFFPHDIGKPASMKDFVPLRGAGEAASFSIPSGRELYSSLNPVSLSIFELDNYRRGRRDDVYRIFQIFIDTLSGGTLSALFQMIRTFIPPDRSHTTIRALKQGLDFSTDSKWPGRHAAIFGEEGIHPEVFVKAVNNYSGVSYISQSFLPLRKREAAFGILNGMEEYVNNRRSYLSPVNHPDRKPDYDWLIGQATALLQLLDNK